LRPFGNLGQPNLLASLLCFGLASLWWTSLTGRIGPRLAGALDVLFLWGLTLTQSRIGWVLMPIFVVFCWISFPTSKSLHKKVLLVLLGAYCVMVVCAPTLLNGVGVTVQGVGQRAGQVSIRLIYLQQAWFMTKLHPWFGAGWFEFGPQQVMFARLFNITEYSENAHNIVANLAVELGLPATILIIGASAYWFYRRCICYWSHPQLGSQVRFITLLFATLAVHSMVEYPLWYALMLLPFGVMIGALDFTSLQQEARAEAEIEAKTQAETNVQQVMPVRAKKMPTIVAIPRAWLVLCCLAALFVMVGVTWDYRRVMIGFTVLEQEQRGVYSTEFTTNRPAYTLFSQFYDYFYIARVKVYPGMPAQDIQFLEKMAIRFGFPPILERLAMAYAYNQRPSEALQVMATVERLHNPAYTGVYARWHSYADKDAGHFLAIFNRMPRPTSL